MVLPERKLNVILHRFREAVRSGARPLRTIARKNKSLRGIHDEAGVAMRTHFWDVETLQFRLRAARESA